MSDTTAAKPVTITLAWYVHEYKVKSVTNTTAFKPGEWLAVEHVERLCQRPGFNVVMVDNDLIQSLTGAVLNVTEKVAETAL